MTVEEIRGTVVGNHEIDRFPIGMRVLAVDDDPTCLKLLEGLLRKCQYQVTTTNQAKTALKMLRENRDRFDLVISDVYMPDMDGFKLLELVGLEMDLPVIMLSANSDPKLVMKGITHGACDYLVKPVRLEELRNIWQHLIRRKVESKPQSKPKNTKNEKSDQGNGSEDQNVKLSRKRKDEDEGEDEENGNESDDPATQKKPRVVWSIDLHRKFVAAVNQLGIEKAVPKRILDLMNVEGLTRENVASHLQKYRLYLKRISHQANTVVAFGGSKDASSYTRMSPLDGFRDFTTMSCAASLPNNSAYAPPGMLSRLNGATGLTLHSLTAPSIVQPNHTQNKLLPVVSSTPLNHQNLNLLHGIPTSFDLDRQQYNNLTNTQLTDFSSIKESPIFTGSSTFTDPSGVLGSQSSNFSLNQLPIGENYSYSATINGGFSSNISNSAAVPIEAHGDGLVGDIIKNVNQSLSNQNQNQKSGPFSKQDYSQYSQNAFTTLASSALASGGTGVGLSGSLSQFRSNGSGSTLVQTEEQTKLQHGFISNGGFGSLDDIMPGMMKREQDPTIIMAGEFGYDHYGFGPCV